MGEHSPLPFHRHEAPDPSLHPKAQGELQVCDCSGLVGWHCDRHGFRGQPSARGEMSWKSSRCMPASYLTIDSSCATEARFIEYAPSDHTEIGYFEAERDLGQWTIGKRVSDQDW